VDEGVRSWLVTTDEKVEDLQAVSQQVLTSADRIRALEQEKRNTPPSSAEFLRLSDEIEALASELRLVSAAETDLARDLQGQDGLPTVEEADTQR
jgi:hypothetical protein